VELEPLWVNKLAPSNPIAITSSPFNKVNVIKWYFWRTKILENKKTPATKFLELKKSNARKDFGHLYVKFHIIFRLRNWRAFEILSDLRKK